MAGTAVQFVPKHGLVRIDSFALLRCSSAMPCALSRTRVCTVRHLSAADTVTVSVKEAQSTTAQALRMIGWDNEAAASRPR